MMIGINRGFMKTSHSHALGSTQLRSYSSQTCAHTHDYYQWVLPLTGYLELEIGHQGGFVNSAQGGLVPPQENHCFASKNDNLFIVLNIQPGKTWMDNLVIPVFWDLSPTIKKFLHFAKDYITQQQEDPTTHILAGDFLQKLLMQHFLTNCDPVIMKARNWIEMHFAEPINLNMLARHCCLSISQLQRRFKRMMGQGIGEYWRKQRLQQAQLLLKRNTTSIEAIAYSVGYENLAAFSRSFSLEFGLSPSKWRNMTLLAKNTLLDDKVSKIS